VVIVEVRLFIEKLLGFFIVFVFVERRTTYYSIYSIKGIFVDL